MLGGFLILNDSLLNCFMSSPDIGLLTAVHKDYFKVIAHRELLFNDFGDRVAQLLHVELLAPFAQCRTNNVRQEMLIVNTHLLFPHDSSFSMERLRQVHQSLYSHFSQQQSENLWQIILIHLSQSW